mmetsp:Transcript_38573/g.73877  ORF Transcript_38573/g.73877 Transcript_38573/m.73877 type:complete len:484 (-) Transcript_38573:529-1980(-)|eukprot:CAMPEP_0114267442 /NCGR_PEP_ID=MMETSP0058-20121206/25298_1 /TAXON_ID=36894 /ORGANISM="Pyramimonas parkeae, CCMP726" /LENGTH=483 /DNA_ID=CAMNT_0001385295 /DNA_START=35 /DNA_END=1486 /DNA_ORIENTATION=+
MIACKSNGLFSRSILVQRDPCHAYRMCLKSQAFALSKRNAKKRPHTFRDPRARIVKTHASVADANTPGVLLWFKHDLRTRDHPGIEIAVTTAGESPVVPVYILDPDYAERSSPSKLMFTIESVSQLRESLKEIGSDLVVRMGRPAEVLPALATSLSCSNIVTEEELQSSWRNTISSAEEALQVSGIQMRRWSIELRPWGDRMDQTLEGVKSFRQAPAPEFDYTVKPGNFMSGAPTHPAEPLQPLPAPTSLPSLPSTLDVGSLPSIDQVRELAGKPDPPNPGGPPLARAVAEARLRRQLAMAEAAAVAARGSKDLRLQATTSKELQRWRKVVRDGDMSALPAAYRVPPGETAAREAFSAFLRFHEASGYLGAVGPLYDAVIEYYNQRDGTLGEAFNTLFEDSVLNGCVSWRSLVAEAVAYECDPERSGRGVWFYDGPLNPRTGYAMFRVNGFPTVQSVVSAAERYDFLNHQARQRLGVASALEA